MAILPLTRKGFTTVLKQLAKKAIAACGFELHRQRNPVPAPAWSQLLNNAEGVQLKRTSNPLEQFFDSHTEGPGIWKWRHYFEIYHKHFSKFVGKEVHVLEIGVYSGGSLAMWKHYFGPQSKIYGVDIEPACKAYEDAQVKILVGDQADRLFWKRVIREVPQLDIIIDDGGHEAHQQIATMEALLPHLSPNGVFLCEDIMQEGNPFFDYVCKFANHLNAYNCQESQELRVTPTSVQRAIHSVHLYPLVAVIERRSEPLMMVAPKHGTDWQPFLR